MLPLGQSYLEWPGRGKGEVRPVEQLSLAPGLGNRKTGPAAPRFVQELEMACKNHPILTRGNMQIFGK